nr:LOW QUALITY PROTEIN: galectin-12 [Aedes albopictus]
MNDRPFQAQIPRKPAVGDEVIVKGMLKPDARVFSVNLILPQPPPIQKSLSAPSESPVKSSSKCCASVQTSHSWPYIAYHFKVVFNDDGSSIVVQNWKNVVWQNEKRTLSHNFEDRTKPFTLIFRFHHDTIRVFVDHTHHTPDYEFEYQLPLERIRTVEVWDDVLYVEEVTFRFKNAADRSQDGASI